MTLADIASWVNQSTGFKLTEEQLVLIMDAVQRLAFDEAMEAFKVYEAMSIYQKLSVASFSVDPVAGDVGLPVVGAGGAEGTLISYVNTEDEAYLVVDSEDDFEDGEAFTITGGTGAGTLAATDAQEGYVGPYDFPAYSEGETKVRKFYGVTTVSDAALFGTECSAPTTDYGMLPRTVNLAHLLVPGRPDEIGGTFTFTNPPSRGDSHRWIYWQEPPTIENLDAESDANLRIPKRYHFNFMRACQKVADLTIERRPYTRADVEEEFGPWWQSLRRKYTPNGRGRNLTQNGSQYGSSLV